MGMIQIDEQELRDTQDQAAQAIPWKNAAIRLAENIRRNDPSNPLLQDEVIQHALKQVDKERESFDPRHDAEGTKLLANASEGKKSHPFPMSAQVNPISADS